MTAVWRRLAASVQVHLRGIDAVLIGETLDAPQPVDVRFVAVSDAGKRVAHLWLTMVAKDLGTVPNGMPAGTVLDTFTVQNLRRRGLARALWAFAWDTAIAERWGFQPRHSSSRTRDGDLFARAVSGDVPPLANDRYVEIPSDNDPSRGVWSLRRHLHLE